MYRYGNQAKWVWLVSLLWVKSKTQDKKLNTSHHPKSYQFRLKNVARVSIRSAIHSKVQRSKHSWREQSVTRASHAWLRVTIHQHRPSKMIGKGQKVLFKTWRSAKDSSTHGFNQKTSSTREERDRCERRWSPLSFKTLSSPKSWRAPGWGQKHSPTLKTMTMLWVSLDKPRLSQRSPKISLDKGWNHWKTCTRCKLGTACLSRETRLKSMVTLLQRVKQTSKRAEPTWTSRCRSSSTNFRSLAEKTRYRKRSKNRVGSQSKASSLRSHLASNDSGSR